jgi:hypothetical protein
VVIPWSIEQLEVQLLLRICQDLPHQAVDFEHFSFYSFELWAYLGFARPNLHLGALVHFGSGIAIRLTDHRRHLLSQQPSFIAKRVFDGFDEACPVFAWMLFCESLSREEEYFEWLSWKERGEDLILQVALDDSIISVPGSLRGVYIDDGLGHDRLVWLDDDGNQEVQQDDGDEELVNEPNAPDAGNHEVAIGSTLFQLGNFRPEWVLWHLDVADGVSVGSDGEHKVGIHLWIVTILAVFNLDADDLIELSKNNDPEKEEECEGQDIDEYIQQKINQLAKGIKDCHIRHEFENAHRNEDYVEHQNYGEASQR